MAYATVEDVESRFTRELTDEERTLVQSRLEDVEAVILTRIPDLDEKGAGGALIAHELVNQQAVALPAARPRPGGRNLRARRRLLTHRLRKSVRAPAARGGAALHREQIRRRRGRDRRAAREDECAGCRCGRPPVPPPSGGGAPADVDVPRWPALRDGLGRYERCARPSRQGPGYESG